MGTARFSSHYIKYKMHVLGGDISADMIEMARLRLGDSMRTWDVRVTDARQLPFADATADIAISTRFIQWLPDLDAVGQVLTEFRRVTRGTLLVEARVVSSGEASVQGRPVESWSRKVRRWGPHPILLWQRVRGRRTLAEHRARVTYFREDALMGALSDAGWGNLDAQHVCPFDKSIRIYLCSASPLGESQPT